MRWIGTLVLLLAFVGLTATARAEVEAKRVEFKSGDDKVAAFVAHPKGKGPFPVVVVIQEWWGLTDWIENNARHFADQGYLAVAPDLYRGKVGTTREEASQLLKGLPKDRALRDLKAAIDYATSRPDAAKDKVGVVGWCMGGGYAINLALADDRVDAVAICYGAVPTSAEAVKGLKASVLGVFGEEDKGIPPATVNKFEAALKEAGKKVEKIHIYKAGHGFMREGTASDKNPAYRAEPAQDAWKQIDAFFAKNLK